MASDCVKGKRRKERETEGEGEIYKEREREREIYIEREREGDFYNTALDKFNHKEVYNGKAYSDVLNLLAKMAFQMHFVCLIICFLQQNCIRRFLGKQMLAKLIEIWSPPIP